MSGDQTSFAPQIDNNNTTSAVEEAINLSNTLRKNEKAIGKKISRALSTPHLATNDDNNKNNHTNNNGRSSSNDPNQSDSYEEIVVGDNNNANNYNSHNSSYSRNNTINNSGRLKSYVARDRIHSFSASTTTSASSTSSTSTAYHENGACCAQLSEQQQQMHHTHIHCQHHHSHRQDIPYTDSNESDDNNAFLNAAVDNCGVSNYATLNLDDQEIEKYFTNISSNFSRNSSIRRSVRNFNKSSTGTGSGTSRRTTPASSNRASPYIFDQLSNTVTCLKPKRATYYSDTSYSSMSSRNSTLTRNKGGGNMMGSSNSVNGQKPFINIDNLTYYETQQQQQQSSSNHQPGEQSVNGNYGRQVPDLKWNFLSDLRKEKEKQQRERERRKSDVSQMMPNTQTMHRRKKDEYWKLRQSAQNVNNISIWCAENDERNAIIFHHESEVVENCSGNMYPYLPYLTDQNFGNHESNSTAKRTNSSDVLNNTFDARSKMSGSLQNMQHNVFSRSSSNVYNITDEFKVFEKQSNLTRDSINLSHNYLHSLSSSHSSLYTAGNHLANHNLNKVLNTSRTSQANSQGGASTSSNRTLNVENNLSYNFSTIQYEKPSHLQSLTAQNQLQQNQELQEFDNGYFLNENHSHINNSSSTEAMLSSSNNQATWRQRRIQDPVGVRSIFRTIRNTARRYLQNDAKNKKNHKNMN